MLGVLFSGGKDSVLASIWTMMQGFDPVLITIKTKPYSMLLHYPNLHITSLQAKLMGLPHRLVESKDGDEKALEKVLRNFDGVVSGAIQSDYQRRILEEIAEKLNIPSYTPLWHKGVLDDVIEQMEVYISAVSAEGLSKEYLGKRFKLKSIPTHVNPTFEGGEGETLVCFAPLFSKRILIDKWRIEWDGVRGIAYAERYHLV